MSKIALITGGNRGLGRATALELIEQGIDVIYTYRSDPGEKIDAVALQLTVGDLDAYESFAQELKTVLRDRYDRENFDFLINNAGVGLAATVAETTVDDFDEMMNVHFRGMYFLTQKMLPLIADGGRIVNFSSGLARFTGLGVYPAYGALKAAVDTFSRYLAKELGPRGISVNTIAPGPTATEFGGGALARNEQVRSLMASQNVFGRMGEPKDIVPVIASLLRDDMGWVTAQRIEASGGMLI